MIGWIKEKILQKKRGDRISHDDKSSAEKIYPSRETERILEALLNEYKADNTKKGREDEKKIVLEKLTLGVVTVYTVVTIGLWCSQQTANKINQQALIDANRPWIKVTIIPSNLMLAPEGPPLGDSEIMSPSIIVENMGHSPAMNVQAEAFPYLDGTKEPIERVQKNACASLTNDGAAGRILFPGDGADMSDDGVGTVGFGISQMQINNVAPETTIGGKKGFGFTIYGCADYAFGTPPIHYQTYFAYRAWHVLAGNSGITGEFALGEGVPVANIRLYPTFTGNDAN